MKRIEIEIFFVCLFVKIPNDYSVIMVVMMMIIDVLLMKFFDFFFFLFTGKLIDAIQLDNSLMDFVVVVVVKVSWIKIWTYKMVIRL